MQHVDRLPRKLWYRWSTGAEIEYPPDIPTPAPEIKCDTVQVTVPPALPANFIVYATQPAWSQQSFQANALVNGGISYAVPTIISNPWYSTGYCEIKVQRTNANGTTSITNSASGAIYVCGSAYMTPGNTQQPRRDFLVGADRIVNPTLNTPCPTWRFTGGNCPPGSLDCGNCCLDCASVKAGIEGLTASVLPFSTWRPRL